MKTMGILHIRSSKIPKIGVIPGLAGQNYVRLCTAKTTKASRNIKFGVVCNSQWYGSRIVCELSHT